MTSEPAPVSIVQCVRAKQLTATEFCFPIITFLPPDSTSLSQVTIQCMHVKHWPKHLNYRINTILTILGLSIDTKKPMALHLLNTYDHPNATKIKRRTIHGLDNFEKFWKNAMNAGTMIYTPLPNQTAPCLCHKPRGVLGVNLPPNLIESTLTFYPSIKPTIDAETLSKKLNEYFSDNSPKRTAQQIYNIVKRTVDEATQRNSKRQKCG